MKLIGAALPRTGTMSLYTALTGLDVRCYHMKEVLLNTFKGRNDLGRWRRVFTLASGSPERLALLQEILEGYDACCDAPCCYVYPELMQLHPEASVMLTRRDPARWRASVAETIYGQFYLKSLSPVATVGIALHRVLFRLPVFWIFGVIGTFMGERRMVWGPFMVDGVVPAFDDPAAGPGIEQHFTDWISSVESSVPPEKLIVLEAPYPGAYEKLCDRLSKPIPEQSYPHVNDKAELKMGFKAIRIIFHLITLLTILGSTLVIGLLIASSPLAVLAAAALTVLLLYVAQKSVLRIISNIGTTDQNNPA